MIGKFKPVFTVLFLAHGMLMLVNNLESSFARTLVRCDTSAESASAQSGPWSGSLACGDRNKVINGGTVLSSWANSLENAAKMLIMVSAAILSDIYGRKPVMLTGLFCTTLSTVLFMVAASVGGDVAHALFIAGQGLQGLYPDTLLCGLIVADLASRKDVDSVSMFEAGSQISNLSSLVFMLVGFVFQFVDPANYLPIWILAFLVNAGTLFLAIRDCPETRQLKDDSKRGGLLTSVCGELKTYADMLSSVDGMIPMLASFTFASMADYAVISIPMLMAYHGMSLPFCMLFFFPLFIVQGVCMPFVGSLRKKYGYKNAFLRCVFIKFSTVLFTPLVPVYWWPLYFLVYTSFGLMSGYPGFLSAIEAHVWGDRASKWTMITSLSGFTIKVVMGPIYSSLFDAGATTYLEKARPCLLSVVFTITQFFLLFGGSTKLMAIYNEHLELMESEAKAKESAGHSTGNGSGDSVAQSNAEGDGDKKSK
eukprot:TRINITY_DN32816_c0_g1_i1.p1 TRINITY_DN32816_c0_g1~~TRINITY_DN32816_c0_g1_i1.p1  ORF type:complete len:505 (-),score=85.15 TRINITY_DN32816_c0_g1_i1:206-1645(-)